MRNPELDADLAYIQKTFAPEDDGLREIRSRLRAANREGVNVSAIEGKILQFLMNAFGVRKIVEVGALYGYSAVWIARSLPQGSKLFTIEKDEMCVEQTQKSVNACGVADRVEVLCGDWAEVLPSLSSKGPFDAVFIDANKNGYFEILKWSIENVRKGGLIIGDNTLLFGAAKHEVKPEDVSQEAWTAMRSFNQTLADPSKFVSCMLPTSEGMTLAIKL
jgi:caffeoyl-CoA O-methyltransferase